MSRTETNIVPVDVPDALALARAAKEEGVLLSVVGPRRVRLVTHLDVDDAGVRRAGEVVARLLQRAAARSADARAPGPSERDRALGRAGLAWCAACSAFVAGASGAAALPGRQRMR